MPNTEILLQNHHTPCLLPRFAFIQGVDTVMFWGISGQMDRETWENAATLSLTLDAAISGHCMFRACIRIVFTVRVDHLRFIVLGAKGLIGVVPKFQLG